MTFKNTGLLKTIKSNKINRFCLYINNGKHTTILLYEGLGNLVCSAFVCCLTLSLKSSLCMICGRSILFFRLT